MGKLLDKIKKSDAYQKLKLFWDTGAQRGKELKKKHKEKLKGKDEE